METVSSDQTVVHATGKNGFVTTAQANVASMVTVIQLISQHLQPQLMINMLTVNSGQLMEIAMIQPSIHKTPVEPATGRNGLLKIAP